MVVASTGGAKTKQHGLPKRKILELFPANLAKTSKHSIYSFFGIKNVNTRGDLRHLTRCDD